MSHEHYPEGTVVINGQITKWVLGIVGTGVALLLGFLITVIANYQERLADLERFQAETSANRFDDQDARELYRDMIRYHDDNTPPPEVSLQLLQLDERLDRLEGGR